MTETTIYQWLTFLLPPITGLLTWFTSRYVRRTTTLETMQKSIDMIIQKNKELYEEITTLRTENAELKVGQQRISSENEGLRKQLDDLMQENVELKHSMAELKQQLKVKNKAQ